MKQKIYVVDAFTNQLFKGNQAAVLIMDQWPSALWMQNVAMENQYSETAFVVKTGDHFQLRWFTPSVEVDLCGHATLAACYILWTKDFTNQDLITLESNSGKLFVKRTDKLITLDFPIFASEKVKSWDKQIYQEMFGSVPLEIWEGEDKILFFETAEEVRNLTPNFELIKNQTAKRGWIAIARADGAREDYVFRFFAPNYGINEDPATGSAQCSIAFFWDQKFQQTSTISSQLSKRGAQFKTEISGSRVKISGEAVLYLSGEIDGETRL